MTMIGGRIPKGTGEVGQTLASYPTYERAQATVQKLVAGEVPARDIAIVGQGLRSVERVTGRLGYATAARSGAINGLLIGLLFSAILVIGSPDVPVQAFVGVLFVGIALGMLLSLVTFAFVRRRRSYASVMQVVADHYEVTVAAASFTRAREVLNHTSTGDKTPPPTAPAIDLSEPPRYGERIADPASAPEAPPVPPKPADPQPDVPETDPQSPRN
jgi:hypothetical protein